MILGEGAILVWAAEDFSTIRKRSMKTSGVQEGCRLGLRPDLIAQFILSF
jgi:hypothetical protein